ncbi:unnamed protein product [Clavelina lepadiformis]|uniref:Uncharacterized protein n=1 Tax=Clavelina lepadiformis TaxID=159417 RepID=A0ABP0GRE7_CLALP
MTSSLYHRLIVLKDRCYSGLISRLPASLHQWLPWKEQSMDSFIKPGKELSRSLDTDVADENNECESTQIQHNSKKKQSFVQNLKTIFRAECEELMSTFSASNKAAMEFVQAENEHIRRELLEFKSAQSALAIKQDELIAEIFDLKEKLTSFQNINFLNETVINDLSCQMNSLGETVNDLTKRSRNMEYPQDSLFEPYKSNKDNALKEDDSFMKFIQKEATESIQPRKLSKFKLDSTDDDEETIDFNFKPKTQSNIASKKANSIFASEDERLSQLPAAWVDAFDKLADGVTQGDRKIKKLEKQILNLKKKFNEGQVFTITMEEPEPVTYEPTTSQQSQLSFDTHQDPNISTGTNSNIAGKSQFQADSNKSQEPDSTSSGFKFNATPTISTTLLGNLGSTPVPNAKSVSSIGKNDFNKQNRATNPVQNRPRRRSTCRLRK